MTSHALAQVTCPELEYAAHKYSVDIEIDNASDRAYVRIGPVTLYAELPTEVTC